MLVRPPRRDEAEAVLAVVIARDIADVGRPDYTLEDVLDDWAAPHLELVRDTFVVEDDGRLVGYADADRRGARVFVHPEHEGRGAGTLLRVAVEARMRELGVTTRQELAAANVAGVEHLRAAGYVRRGVTQRMRADLTAIAAPPAARARPLDLDAEGVAAHALIELAFSEIAGRSPQLFESWSAQVRSKSEPAFRLALDDDDGLAGVALGERWPDGVGYVAQLAVAGRARGRSLGRTLLLELLAAFADEWLTIAELMVAGSNDVATDLYESVGMTPDFRSESWELVEPA